MFCVLKCLWISLLPFLSSHLFLSPTPRLFPKREHLYNLLFACIQFTFTFIKIIKPMILISFITFLNLPKHLPCLQSTLYIHWIMENEKCIFNIWPMWIYPKTKELYFPRAHEILSSSQLYICTQLVYHIMPKGRYEEF